MVLIRGYYWEIPQRLTLLSHGGYIKRKEKRERINREVRFDGCVSFLVISWKMITSELRPLDSRVGSVTWL